MGSSKKHKDKDKSREKKKSRRSRSRSRERDGHREKHKSSHKDKSRDRKRTRSHESPDKYPEKKSKLDLVAIKQEGTEPEDKPDEPQGDGSSLNIEETNKLRAKLGLKPLDVGIPGLGSSDAPSTSEDGGKKEVFVKTENILDKIETEKIRQKLLANKEKRRIQENLKKVRTLGESDSDDDASGWVKKNRQLEEERNKARKQAKLLAEMDEEFGVGDLVEKEFNLDKKKEYSAKNLKGLEVAHDMERFKEGQTVILTLQDKGVLEEGDDVLENVNLVDQERAEKNVERKKKKPAYQPFEDTEIDEFGIVKKKSILSQYDVEISGEKKETFKIGEAKEVDRERELELIRMKLKQQHQVSLDMPLARKAVEYYTEEEMTKFKKPKKKVRKLRRAKLKIEDILPLGEESSHKDHGSRQRFFGNEPAVTSDVFNQKNFFDTGNPDEEQMQVEEEEEDVVGPDEDLTGVVVEEDDAEKSLYSALNKTRRLKEKESASVEKLAENIRQNTDYEYEDMTDASASQKAIVLNSTAEFCRTLGDIPTYGMSGNRDEEADELLDFERELMEERQRQELEMQNRGAWNEVDIDETPVEIKDRENEPILEEEPDVTIGLAGALKLAVKKGYIERESRKASTAPRHSNLEAKSYTIEEKFYDDDKASRRERYIGPLSDFKEKDAYKPDVKLEYIDDSGRILNAKEAFRYLSHKFHGKGPGKNKIDKRTKKLDQTTKLKQMSSTDTPLSTLKLLQEKQKELQSPYILLSGGTKALNQNSLMKPK